MVEKDEKVEKTRSMMTFGTFEEMEKQGKKTLGFAVGSAPLWLCKAVFKEAKQHYGDIYWPV